MDATKSLKEIAVRVLSRDDVACLLGYEKGSYGFRVQPCVITSPDEADRLVYSPLCVHNLANYLTLENSGPLTGKAIGSGKIAVVVKGCDSRALAVLIAENGIDRDSLYIIGIHSPGVVDLKKLENRFPDVVEPADVTLDGDTFLISCEGKTVDVPRDELLNLKCKRCRNKAPVIYDEIIGDPQEESDDDFADILESEQLPLEEKRNKWQAELSRCIRCYACRNVCPLCYCSDCMLDRLNPQFLRRTVDCNENLLFHITRAFHLAGRCVQCGECERVCPQEIPLMELNRKLAKDVKEMFDYESGTDPEAHPLFATFRTEDPDEGIL